MTITFYELFLYIGGLIALWMIPGPVLVALVARSLSSGFSGAWPLALGVTIGDMLWPVCAIFGLSWILSLYSGFLELLKWSAAIIFITMGIMLLRPKSHSEQASSRLTKPGVLAGFSVGLVAVIGNPKTILFYMGVLPGFFNMAQITMTDTLIIAAISALLPFSGNLLLALFIDKSRRLLQSPKKIHQLNMISGLLLIAVGLAVPFT